MMTFDWNKYLLLADELRLPAGNAGMEARLRCSISRGYYGVFHLVRLRLEQEGVRFAGGGDIHQQLVQHLVTSGNQDRKKLGKDLGRLRQLRNEADYEGHIDNVAYDESVGRELRESVRVLLGMMN